MQEELLSLMGPETIEKIRMLLALASLVLALMECYFGYKFLRFWIGVAGMILGCVLGITVALRFFEYNTWYPWVIMFICGVIFALLSYSIYKVGVFIFCGLIAASAIYAVMQLPVIAGRLTGVGDLAAQIITFAPCLIAFILFGILAVKYSKPIIIVITAVAGAMLAVRTLSGLLPNLAASSLYQLVATAAFGISGIVLQHLMNYGKK